MHLQGPGFVSKIKSSWIGNVCSKNATTWFGVECTLGHVSRLDLSAAIFGGVLGPQLYLLSKLTFFKCLDCYLTGKLRLYVLSGNLMSSSVFAYGQKRPLAPDGGGELMGFCASAPHICEGEGPCVSSGSPVCVRGSMVCPPKALKSPSGVSST